jgi:hypothetical protein
MPIFSQLLRASFIEESSRTKAKKAENSTCLRERKNGAV